MLELTEEEELIKQFVGDLADKYGRSYWLACSREGRFTKELRAEVAAGGAFGSPLPPGLAGGHAAFDPTTEPAAGSNSFRIETLARRDGDSYLLSGQKAFITGANKVGYIMVGTRTTPLAEAEGHPE